MLTRTFLICILSFSIFAGLLSCVTQSPACRQPGDVFNLHVKTLNLASTTAGVPELQTLPDAVYADVLALRSSDMMKYQELVCRYLMVYEEFYQRHFRQSYSLISPSEVESLAYLREGNNRFFVLRCFMDFSGYAAGKDGFPSNAAGIWWRANKPTGSSKVP